jgi:regulator of RNase E activity RraA
MLIGYNGATITGAIRDFRKFTKVNYTVEARKAA